MPSAYGIVDLFENVDQSVAGDAARYVTQCADIARSHGLFVEWLMAFIAGWEATKDPWAAASGALTEWDM